MRNCCPTVPVTLPAPPGRDYARVLALALALNAMMFGVEICAGIWAGSSALLADATDFAGDAANYALSLGALALAPAWRSRAALAKGFAMIGYGVLVVAGTVWHALTGTVPDVRTMALVGTLALSVNFAVAALLYRYRAGDADMRSVWLCTRNDVIGNIAVLLAAAGVFGTAAGWPDYAVAGAMAALALSSGIAVVRVARREMTGRPCA